MMFPSSFETYLCEQYVIMAAFFLKILLVTCATSLYMLVGYVTQNQVSWPKDASFRHRFVLGSFWPLFVLGYLVMLPRLRQQQAEKAVEQSKNKHSFLNWKAS